MMDPLKAEKIKLDLTELGTAEDIMLVKSKSALDNENLLKFLLRLNQALDIEVVIKELTRTILSFVTIHHLEYQHTLEEIHITIGDRQPHTFEYRLRDERNYDLGLITLSRNYAFDKKEIETIEILLSYSILPLRNNLEHQSVLKSSLIDSLTDTGNRRALDDRLQVETEQSKRFDQPFSVIALDIDRFKSINDSYGHDAGDHVLRKLCDSLKKSLREYDQVFRTGGEEFIIVLNQADPGIATAIAERIRKKIAETHFIVGDQTLQVTVSIGVACYSRGESTDQLMKRADEALYRAKKEGRNCIRI